MVAGGPKADRFREWAADLIRRFREGDPALAAGIIDRQEDPEALRRLARRAEARASVKELNATIHEHGGTGRIYSRVADLNNTLATGMSAQQIRDTRGGSGSSRDSMTALELAAVNFAQEAERQNIVNEGATGNGEIFDACAEVVHSIIPVVSRFREKTTPARAPALARARTRAPTSAPIRPLPDRAEPGQLPWLKHLRRQ